MTEEVPKYVANAKFINESNEVEDSWWPREPYMYRRTKAWSKRVSNLEGVIDKDKIEEVIKTGELYDSLDDSVTFVSDLTGVALYVVVSAKLRKKNGEYPTAPRESDYEFRAVTVWPYVYDRTLAWLAGDWDEEELKQIKEICEENSGQSEQSKYDISDLTKR